MSNEFNEIKLKAVPAKEEPIEVVDKKALRELLSEKFTEAELEEQMYAEAESGNYEEAIKIRDVLNARKGTRGNL